MEHWELALLNIGSVLFMAILGFLIKRNVSQIDKRLEDGDQKFKDFSTTMGRRLDHLVWHGSMRFAPKRHISIHIIPKAAGITRIISILSIQ